MEQNTVESIKLFGKNFNIVSEAVAESFAKALDDSEY